MEIIKNIEREQLRMDLPDFVAGLRFAFIDRLGNEQALRFLREFQNESEAYVRHLEEIRGQMQQNMSPCGRLALEHGIQGTRGSARWAQKAIEELSKLEKK